MIELQSSNLCVLVFWFVLCCLFVFFLVGLLVVFLTVIDLKEAFTAKEHNITLHQSLHDALFYAFRDGVKDMNLILIWSF